jgi:hypothetical protein
VSHHTWLLIIATGTVQGVYGSALRDMAEACLARVPMGHLIEYAGPRPSVGDKAPIAKATGSDQ